MFHRDRGFAALRPVGPIALLLAIALLVACASPIKTGYDIPEGADPSKYKSYAWVTADLMSANDPMAADYISPLDDARVRRTSEGVLNAKGYSKVAFDRADLAVAFTVLREEKLRQNMQPGARVYYPNSYGSAYGGMAVTYDQYTEGTLSFHFFDRKTRQLVWKGFASKRLSKKHEPPELIDEIVEQILLKFPPPAS